MVLVVEVVDVLVVVVVVVGSVVVVGVVLISCKRFENIDILNFRKVEIFEKSEFSRDQNFREIKTFEK